MLGGVRRLLLLLPVLCLEAACSYAFVRGPAAPPATLNDPSKAETSALDCTASNAAPIADTVIAVPALGVGVLAIVAGAGENCGSTCYVSSAGTVVAVGLALTGLGALALSSAITGYGRTADCRRAQESLQLGPRPAQRYLLDVPAIAHARGEGGP